MAVITVRGRKSAIVATAAPDAPENFTSLPWGDSVETTWDAVLGATSYKLYYNTVNNSATATLINNSNVLEYVHTGRAASTVHYYWISSVVGGIESTKVVTSRATGAYRTDIINASNTAMWNPSGENFMTRFSINPGDVIMIPSGTYSTLDFNGYFDDITLCTQAGATVLVTGRINFGAEGKHHRVLGNLADAKTKFEVSSGLGGYFACSSRSSGDIYYRNMYLHNNFMGIQVEHRETTDPEYPNYLLNYQRLYIRDIDIDGTGQEAMYIGSNIISPHQIYGHIFNCNVSNCGRDGIQTRNGRFNIHDNTITNVGTNGEDAHGHGILYGGGGGSTNPAERTIIRDNVVTNAAVYGIFCNGYGYVDIIGNTTASGTLTAPTQAQFSGIFFKNYESNTEDIQGVGFQEFTIKDNSFTTLHGSHAIDIRRDNTKCPVTVNLYATTNTTSPNDTYIEDGVHGAAFGIVTNIL